jgi:hypothetical protein
MELVVLMGVGGAEERDAEAVISVDCLLRRGAARVISYYSTASTSFNIEHNTQQPREAHNKLMDVRRLWKNIRIYRECQRPQSLTRLRPRRRK